MYSLLQVYTLYGLTYLVARKSRKTAGNALQSRPTDRKISRRMKVFSPQFFVTFVSNVLFFKYSTTCDLIFMATPERSDFNISACGYILVVHLGR
jgi:hypothetical protein